MVMMPLMDFLNQKKGYDIYGYRNKKNNYTYYIDKISNKYFCNKISSYIDLFDQGYNVYILTNSLSYYNKFKHKYKIQFFEHFLYDDLLIYNTDKIYTKEGNLTQIIGDYQIIYLNIFDKMFLKDEIDYIIENQENELVVSDLNSYLNKKYTKIDEVTEYIKFKTKTITFEKMHRGLCKYNYIIDLPLDNSSITEMSSIVFYPFHYKFYLDEVFFIIPLRSYEMNKDTYEYFIKKGMLSFVEKNKFVKLKVNKQIYINI